jgi:hypothetical protein
MNMVTRLLYREVFISGEWRGTKRVKNPSVWVVDKMTAVVV